MVWKLFRKPKRPKMPDFTKLAEQTAASNQEAQTRADFSNRPTINTPWGTESWQTSAGVDPSTGKAVTSWTQNTELNPLAQRALDAQQNVSAGRSELAGGMLNRLQSATGKPFDWDSVPARANAPTARNTMVDPAGQARYTQAGPDLQARQTRTRPDVQARYSDAGPDLQATTTQAGPQAQARNIDSMVGDASRQRVEQGMLNRLRPEREFQSAALETQLANRGLTPGSVAYERAKQSQADQFSRDEFNALQAGGVEQQRQFEMARGAADLGFNQENTSVQGMFNRNLGANAQNFGQQSEAAQSRFNRNLGANTQNFAQDMQSGAQSFGQERDANAQNFGQEAQAAQQGFSQRLGANAQNFDQEAQMRDQNFNQRLGANQQGFNQDLDAFNAQNQNRQGAIGEQAQQRNMPLNELNALLSGQQVGDLKTPDFNTSRSTGGADYSGAGQDSYDANMNVYNQRMAGYNRNMKAITNVASTAAQAFFSDARLKSNVVRVGTHPLGVGVYEYDIFGRRERGVMAQELIHVAPDLVHVDGSGFYKVDYAGL